MLRLCLKTCLSPIELNRRRALHSIYWRRRHEGKNRWLREKEFLAQYLCCSIMDEIKCEFCPKGSHLCSPKTVKLCLQSVPWTCILLSKSTSQIPSERPFHTTAAGSERLTGDQEQTSDPCSVLAVRPALRWWNQCFGSCIRVYSFTSEIGSTTSIWIAAYLKLLKEALAGTLILSSVYDKVLGPRDSAAPLFLQQTCWERPRVKRKDQLETLKTKASILSFSKNKV